MQNASSSPSPERTPGPEQLQSSRLVHYQRWLEREGGVATRDYAELWRWSVDDLSRFCNQSGATSTSRPTATASRRSDGAKCPARNGSPRPG